MHILLAPDKFKGTLTAKEVTSYLKEGILKHSPEHEVTELPLADGGEGSMEAIKAALGGENVQMFVKNPLFKTDTASYLRVGDTAYVEMAAASGLQLIKPSQRNPEFTTTYGTGQLLKHAWKNGCKEIFLFVGGSATNDGGIGIASAFGYSFKDSEGNELPTIGMSLNAIASITPPEAKPDFKLHVACDVNNPLYGPDGAAHVFAAQKGADAAMLERLDAGLVNLSDRIKQDLGIDVSTLAGGGAAGGVGAGAVAFLGADIRMGAASILEITGFDSLLAKADVVITGEGKLDEQTLHNKLAMVVCERAKASDKKVIAVAGKVDLADAVLSKAGFDQVFDLTAIYGSEIALTETRMCVEQTGLLIAKSLQ